MLRRAFLFAQPLVALPRRSIESLNLQEFESLQLKFFGVHGRWGTQTELRTLLIGEVEDSRIADACRREYIWLLQENRGEGPEAKCLARILGVMA